MLGSTPGTTSPACRAEPGQLPRSRGIHPLPYRCTAREAAGPL